MKQWEIRPFDGCASPRRQTFTVGIYEYPEVGGLEVDLSLDGLHTVVALLKHKQLLSWVSSREDRTR